MLNSVKSDVHSLLQPLSNRAPSGITISTKRTRRDFQAKNAVR